MEHLACRMSSETNIPVSAFGVQGNGYTSSDALAASANNLIVEAHNMNGDNADALKLVGQLAMAIALNKRLKDLTDEESDVKVTFEDPSMLSATQKADFAVKVSSVIDGYGDTRICKEQLGFDSDQCDLLESQVRLGKARQQISFLEDGADENAVS